MLFVIRMHFCTRSLVKCFSLCEPLIRYHPYSDDANREGVGNNPFYYKYKHKLDQHKNEITKDNIICKPPQNHLESKVKRTLDSMIDTRNLLDKTTEEIASFWNSYHSKLDCIYGTLPTASYTLMSTQGALCPYFIYPLPAENEYRFIFQQYLDDEFHFTTLEHYNSLGEHAPIYLTLSYYSEFAKEKDIVLMVGKFDLDQLKIEEAQLITQLTQLYFGQKNKERADLIRKFNLFPNLFDYQELIHQFQELKFV